VPRTDLAFGGLPERVPEDGFLVFNTPQAAGHTVGVAYIDVLRVFAIMVPLLFLTKPPKGKAPAGAH
jgi:hypothetical protein